MNKLVYILEKIKSINDKYDEIEKINGMNFNIFSILNMERHEVKTHSNFIYELLNPKGLHSKGDIFLKLFFEKVLNLEYDIDIKTILVTQEDVTSEKRRIDFTIETLNYQIGIEMKIDADDQVNQMYDYYKELDERKKGTQNVKLFYLTLDGKEPTDKSIKKDSKVLENENYKLISFKNNIVDWLEECIKESATNTTVREALVQYLNLVNKITNKSNSIGRVVEISKILSNEKNLKIYLEAEESVIEAKKHLQLGFWMNLIEKLNKFGLNFKFDLLENVTKIEDAVENYYKENQKNKHYGITLYLDEEKDIYIFIAVDHYLYCQIGSEKENNTNIKNLYKWNVIDEFNSYKLILPKLNFNNLLDTPYILELFDENELNKVTDNIIHEIKEIKKDIDKVLLNQNI